MTIEDLYAFADQQRREHGFMSLQEVVSIIGATNVVLDPFSLLISRRAKIGTGNIFYQNVVLMVSEEGTLEIGGHNVFFPSCFLSAGPGAISIGSNNEFGDGGFAAKANIPGARIEIGNDGRYTGGPQLLGKTSLGSGTQVIGAVTVQDCSLEGGESYRGQEPDNRGALLKGHGLARGIELRRGEVIQNQGLFDATEIRKQSSFHRKPSP